MTDPQALADSERVVQARSRAQQRLRRQRATLRPFGIAVIAIVVVGSASAHPTPGTHGKGLAILLALGVFAIALAVTSRDRFPDLGARTQAAVIGAMGAAAVVLAGFQPHGPAQIATGAAVFLAVTRLPLRTAIPLAGAVTAGLGLATALAGGSAASVVADMLVPPLLGLIAGFLKQSRESQDRTELLLAQLEDARDEQARAAALAERGRIAGELHDVLAHSLSGAAIQLQGARKLAEREHAGSQLGAAIDRATELVKAGLANARQAVGALRGEALPSVAQLDSLVDSYRTDMNVDVTLRIEGQPRTLPAETNLALYRGAQEALTNVARYAPSAVAIVVLRYEPDRTVLRVENGTSAEEARHGLGGGHGLAGMRERIEQAGGTMSAGPRGEGWRVEVEVPA